MALLERAVHTHAAHVCSDSIGPQEAHMSAQVLCNILHSRELVEVALQREDLVGAALGWVASQWEGGAGAMWNLLWIMSYRSERAAAAIGSHALFVPLFIKAIAQSPSSEDEKFAAMCTANNSAWRSHDTHPLLLPIVPCLLQLLATPHASSAELRGHAIGTLHHLSLNPVVRGKLRAMGVTEALQSAVGRLDAAQMRSMRVVDATLAIGNLEAGAVDFRRHEPPEGVAQLLVGAFVASIQEEDFLGITYFHWQLATGLANLASVGAKEMLRHCGIQHAALLALQVGPQQLVRNTLRLLWHLSEPSSEHRNRRPLPG